MASGKKEEKKLRGFPSAIIRTGTGTLYSVIFSNNTMTGKIIVFQRTNLQSEILSVVWHLLFSSENHNS